MSDERRQRLLDQYEDAALQLLMDEYAEAEGKLLLEEFEAAEKRGEVGEIPEELDQKCKQIIHKSLTTKRNKDRLFAAGRLLSKVAVFLFVLTGLSATLVLSVEAFRIPILNYILNQEDRFSTMIFMSEREPINKSHWKNIDIEDCLPNGFNLDIKKETPDGGYLYSFINETGSTILIQITQAYGMINFDTENTAQISLEINGYEAILIDEAGFRILWLDPERDYVFDVSAIGLSEIEFWKVVYRLTESD